MVVILRLMADRIYWLLMQRVRLVGPFLIHAMHVKRERDLRHVYAASPLTPEYVAVLLFGDLLLAGRTSALFPWHRA